ncbi:MAG: hypothetical protein PHX51_07135 [Clostridia bacterium]|nr:hypothetical protein [Clostridia bacterium]
MAQTQEIAFIGTVANSASKVVTVDVTPTIDSIAVNLYSYGEIDLDSLDVKLGLVTSAKLSNNRVNIEYWAASTTYSKTLTVNLDSVTASYLVRKTVIPKSALTGYQKVKLTVIAAASGNDATDPKQKLLVIIDKYE